MSAYQRLASLLLWAFASTVVQAAPQVYYYHNDHLGTPQVMTDANQQVVWQADYEPFGQATVTTEAITNPLRFPGQYFDAETGLHQNWHRDYSPDIGRYITSDPMSVGEHVRRHFALKKIALSQPNPVHLGSDVFANNQALLSLPLEINSYVRTGNNPLRWIDPTGEASWAEFVIIVGGTAGGFYCYKKGIEKCQQAFPNHKDILHPDRKKFLTCISSVTGVIALGIGWSTDPLGAAVDEVGSQIGEKACGDDCK